MSSDSPLIRETNTAYGRLIVGPDVEIFTHAVTLVADAHSRVTDRPFLCALTGGTTPQSWYGWCVSSRAIPSAFLNSAHFTVSDERQVPLSSEQSNFGHAERELFVPLGVAPERCHSWKTELPPAETVEAYQKELVGLTGAEGCYDVCFLGMGEDAHTASFFPGSPLLQNNEGQFYSSIEVPEKGLRFTVTPAGLKKCGLIIVMTLGASKAPALKRVFMGPYDPLNAPAQILRSCAQRVVWLVDDDAAAELT